MKGPWLVPGGPLPSWTMAVDLLLVLPLAWLLLKPRDWRARWPVSLGLAGAGFLLGRWLAPNGDPLWALLGDVRWLLLGLVVMAELWLLSGLIRQVWRARQEGNAEVVAAQEVHRVFGEGITGRLMQLESRLWVYALMRRPAAAPFPGDQHFGVHRQHGNASNQIGFVIVMGAELPIMHVLLHLAFDATVAWVVTAISAYGWLYLWAEYRATRLRPVSLDAQLLHLRYGLLIDATVPLKAVQGVELLAPRVPIPRATRRLRLEGMGRANVRLRLQAGTSVRLPWGERDTDEIVLGVDEPERFMRAVSGALNTPDAGIQGSV
ncbi:hypothetical protein [Roseateles albus]|uniref:Uncharacterized protein n=1 Tax=Roseateles albus TaxID=2987525 RepID=A0ABT5KD14_9BURK|nr:hypothetical protein [Roseateles albus]MDC8771819.1 hypothetical protein [Roseateles albus]